MGPLTILYVEDHKLLLSHVREMLAAQNWLVETCQDGMSAFEKIASQRAYDVLIFDSSLPDISGLELIRRARSLAHRRRTPIILFSTNDSPKAALRAGADVSLRKPDDVKAIIQTIKRLVGMR
jgi:CheY-like chemotaxis protein